MLRVVSWNLDGLDPAWHSERIEAAVQVLKAEAADIVLLQEVVEAHHAALGGIDGYVLHLPEKPVCSYYVAALVKAETIDVKKVWTAPFSTSRMGRHVLRLACFVKQTGDSINIMTSHLESTTEYVAKAERLRQAHSLCTTMMGDDTFTLLAGDLNIRDAEVQLLQQHGAMDGIKDAWIEAGKKDKTKFTWDRKYNHNISGGMVPKKGSRTARCRFDRAWFSDPTSTWAVKSFSLIGTERIRSIEKHICSSDHFGLSIVFRRAAVESTRKRKAAPVANEESQKRGAKEAHK